MVTPNKSGTCPMCFREEMYLTFHHLIPKTLHSKKWYQKRYSKEELNHGVDICEDCHEALHDFISEKDLGKRYNSLDLLMTHPKVQKFTAWVGRQRKRRNKTRRAKDR